MMHYFPEENRDELEMIAEANGFNGPVFEGQGCSKSVGSDCYGFYITKIKKVGSKTVAGLVHAVSRFETSWTDGSQTCTMPENKTPTEWITQSGWWKNRDGSRGKPKYYFCDENGKKINGAKCTYGFNGAFAYQDPSF